MRIASNASPNVFQSFSQLEDEWNKLVWVLHIFQSFSQLEDERTNLVWILRTSSHVLWQFTDTSVRQMLL